MKTHIIIYLALLLLVIMGAFASMALNGYGVSLMSYAALGFFLVFLVELASVLRQETGLADRPVMATELAVLAATCLVFFLKGQMIEFPLSAFSVPILIALLLAINGYNLVASWRELGQSPIRIRLGVGIYFVGLFLLMAAMYFFPLSGTAGLGLTLLGLASLAYFFATSGRRSAVIVNGERISAVSVVWQLPGKSSITMIAFALITGYLSLGALDVLPPLYYGEMPNAYSKVTRETLNAAGEKKTDPKAFEEAYKKFIRGK